MSPNAVAVKMSFIVGETLILTVPVLAGLSSCLSHFGGTGSAYRDKPSTYRDSDGEALPCASPSQRRRRLAWNSTHGALAISGTATALLRAYLCIDDHERLYLEEWASVGIWMFILFHSGMLVVESDIRKRYVLARNCIMCALSALIMSLYGLYRKHDLTDGIDLRGRSNVAELVLVSLIVMLCLSHPRRPDLFVDAKMVDRESSCSLISRWTFSWPDFLLGLTARPGGVVVDDLPVLGFESRASRLLERFTDARRWIARRSSRRAPLWSTLLLANGRYVALQILLTTVLNFVMYTPHFALLRLLQLLEMDETDSLDDRVRLMLWVLAFGFLTGCSSFLENWVHWINQNKIAIRVQEQLVIAMYDDLLGASATVPNGRGNTADEDEESSTAAQNVANLFAVDAHRIAKCVAILPRAATVPLRVVLACLILKHLLGLESFVAIVATLCLVAPLKFWCFRRYTGIEEDLMSRRDRRVAVVNEAVLGLRQIKMSATEDLWESRIDRLRSQELRTQRKAFTLAAAGVSVQLLGSLLLSASAFAVYAFFHGTLQPSIAFTALAIIGSVDAALFSLPEMIVEILDAAISLGRIDRFFQQRDTENNQYCSSEDISFKNVTATWKQTDGPETSDAGSVFALRDMSLIIPSGLLTAIVGPTGSGKSLMLAAILGECDILTGEVRSPKTVSQHAEESYRNAEDGWVLRGAMAYVSQQPWIEATTIRENILFGLPLDGSRYRQVLFACALLRDFEGLRDGDLTQVGDNGINLSGGQRWRVSLARALYSRAGILILDDIFSAIDVHTSTHVYNHALTGSLAAGRTRVLVTHNLDLCRPDYIVRLERGKIQFSGTMEQLSKSTKTDDLPSWKFSDVSKEGDRPSSTSDTISSEDGSSVTSEPRSRNVARLSQAVDTIDREGCQHGSVRSKQVRRYFAKCGSWPYVVLVVCCYLSYSGLLLGRSWWVKIWSAGKDDHTAHSEQHLHQLHTLAQHVIGVPRIDRSTEAFIGIYVLMSSLAWIAGSVRSYVLLMASLKASRVMFQDLLATVLRAPLGWIDTTPTGRLMNRFTSDFDMLDSYLGFDLSEFLASIMDCAMVLIPSAVASPVLVLVACSLLGLCVLYTRRYLTMAREMKRLESVARSPIYDLLGSSLKGLWTIRAFGRTRDYVDRMQDTVDRHARAAWQLWLLSRWLGFRMNLIGSVFCTATAATVVFQSNTGAAFAGFALTFSIQLTRSMTRAILAYACFELDMNGVERILEYTDIAVEDDRGRDPPAAWPTEGRIDVADLALRYAPHLPPVISDLSLRVESHQRIAVVGRTGAGKSSLALSLFRLLEAERGKILIDGVDIRQIKLHHLRSRLAMIPQDPVLFSGTVRSNLDPFGERSDGELLYALEQVHWHKSRLPEPEESGIDEIRAAGLDLLALDETVAELGSNFSQGQRQLLCLARAVASRPKVLIMDEATSAVDKSTDGSIQESLRSSFENISTLLVIAHRLSTIADFDRILVLDAGQMVEFGHPAELLENGQGVFKSMVDETPDCEAIKAKIMGKK